MPSEYSYALHKAGYYTANPDTYTAGIIKLYNEFLEKIKANYPNVLVLDEIQISNDEVQDTGEDSVLEYFDSKVEKNPTIKEVEVSSKKKIEKSGQVSLVMIVVGGLVTAYAWIAGLF